MHEPTTTPSDQHAANTTRPIRIGGKEVGDVSYDTKWLHKQWHAVLKLPNTIVSGFGDTAEEAVADAFPKGFASIRADLEALYALDAIANPPAPEPPTQAAAGGITPDELKAALQRFSAGANCGSMIYNATTLLQIIAMLNLAQEVTPSDSDLFALGEHVFDAVAMPLKTDPVLARWIEQMKANQKASTPSGKP